jgi:hypothetical protein
MLAAVSGAAGAAERVPDAAVIGGIPQGVFISRSLLTGRTVCLLFLSGGRVTRAVPEGGLENLDWARHQSEHSRDTGRWEVRGGQIAIAWGDGGVHEGPLSVRPDGIEFYGKRYTKPMVVSLDAIVGRWHATRGTAIAGGSGINVASTLIIQPDGRYEWSATTGGVVAGRAVASDKTMAGTVRITGATTIVFTPDAGRAIAHTLLAAAGVPITAFSLDATTFTRVP